MGPKTRLQISLFRTNISTPDHPIPKEEPFRDLHIPSPMRGLSAMAAIPATVKLTQYSTESVTAALQQIVDGVEASRYRLSLDKVFPFVPSFIWGEQL